MGIFQFWVFVTVFGFSLQSLNSQNLTCNSNDRQALDGFMSSLDSAISGWDTTNCCNWVGVTCTNYSLDQRVVKLELGKQRLMGEITDSLGNLHHLKTLNLSHNFLKGPLPISLFQLPNLEVLDLSNNELSNPIPFPPNLPSIHYIDISENSFTGSVPAAICTNSTGLRFFNLAVNYFSGNFAPGFGNCTSLEHLYLGSNYLAGNIPESVFHLQRLKQLSLQDNRLFGQLSNGIGNLSNLVHLDVSLNGFRGELPDVFHTLVNLKYFSAQSNFFSAKIPNSLYNSPSLAMLSLRNNSLEGPIDVNCSAMSSLVSLDLATNQLNGTLPDNLALCPRLQNMNLARNNFSGRIPESFKNFHTLSFLSLSNSSIHSLSSALRILQHCRNLTTLVLTLNFPGDELPSDPSLNFSSLKALIIANCRLTGVIPLWLQNSKQLQLLDLSWNRLGGIVPASFGNFESLFYLDLSNNSLTGEIPKSLTGLSGLIFRNISLKEPYPDFPFFMKRNVSVGGLQYNQIWSFPPTLDLSNNLLTGPIWAEFGNLKRIHILDLKCNNLSGTIPGDLSGMTSIETLDLSHNNLSGSIPPSLVSLSFLSKFSVANNRLYGIIPTGGQFPTFPNSSFEGNQGLCGEHASSPCPGTGPPISRVPSPTKSRRNKGTIIGMAIGIGFGTALVLVLIFVVVLRANNRREIDVEKDEDDPSERELGSRLVVLFQNKDSNKELSIDDLLKSTDNFDQANIIGCGGFGLVFKATLPDGRKVAIKRLTGECGQMEREFQAEVEALSRAQHPNLVLLQGYCKYKNDRLLIYSYMVNGSLDYWLHEKLDGPSSLDWDTRLKIAQGSARGLAYLHQSCEPHILHRDIKSSNILLDENFVAHLADFGLARLILPSDTHVTTDLVGTLGYIPPEYGQAPVATYKGDVYSFGVVLIELLTSKRPMDMCKPKGCRDLISWVLHMKMEKRETEVFDPFVYEKDRAKEMSRVLDVAICCLSECPKIRPSTEQLVSWLDNIGLNTSGELVKK